MLNLAIAIGTDRKGATVVETNDGRVLRVKDWPQDCEFQLVAFSPNGRKGKLVCTDQLAEDIHRALSVIATRGVTLREKPDWYRRLVQYAGGV